VEVAEYGLKVSVIGDSGVSSTTSGLPGVVDEALGLAPELLQAAMAMLSIAATARLFMTACLIA
jgi:hypothetical protein